MEAINKRADYELTFSKNRLEAINHDLDDLVILYDRNGGFTKDQNREYQTLLKEHDKLVDRIKGGMYATR